MSSNFFPLSRSAWTKIFFLSFSSCVELCYNLIRSILNSIIIIINSHIDNDLSKSDDHKLFYEKFSHVEIWSKMRKFFSTNSRQIRCSTRWSICSPMGKPSKFFSSSVEKPQWSDRTLTKTNLSFSLLFVFRERFNDLQSKLQELDVLHPSAAECPRTTTPLSRDSGVPIRSSSSCCSITSDSASTPKSSLELTTDSSPQSSTLHFFLHPPANRRRHVSVHLNEPQACPMAYVQDSIPRYQSQGRHVQSNESQARRSASQHFFPKVDPAECYRSDPISVGKQPQRISLNASLPFEAKLNIRIHADRTAHESQEQMKTTAIIESIDAQREKEYREQMHKTYSTHYAAGTGQQRESRRDKLPRQRQVSLPISLPIDQRLYLYIRDGEVLARC